MQHTLLFVLLSLITHSVFGAELIINGGFETGDFTGWTELGDSSDTGVSSDAIYVESGNDAAMLGPIYGYGTLSQTFGTTQGACYQVSFWLALDDYGIPNDFVLSFTGLTLLNISNSYGFGLTYYQYDVVALSSRSELLLAFYDLPGYFYLDDVSVMSGVAGCSAPAPCSSGQPAYVENGCGIYLVPSPSSHAHTYIGTADITLNGANDLTIQISLTDPSSTGYKYIIRQELYVGDTAITTGKGLPIGDTIAHQSTLTVSSGAIPISCSTIKFISLRLEIADSPTSSQSVAAWLAPADFTVNGAFDFENFAHQNGLGFWREMCCPTPAP